MNIIKLKISFFLFLFAAFSCCAQQNQYDLSAPTDLKEVGVNKVLCMKNGNTMLFHFEPRKEVVVKVFDSLHKEIASRKHVCKFLDINYLDFAVFKGLYDINGEAVLFVEQEQKSKKQLVRVRFNATSGDIIEEYIAGEAESISRPTEYYVMKNKSADGYAILFSSDAPQYKDCTVYVEYYSNKHETLRKVPIDIDRKACDYLQILGAEAQPGGDCITICLKTLVTNATSHVGGATDTKAIYDHVVMMAYIPDNSSIVRLKKVDVSTTVFPFYTEFTYNAFAGKLNLLLFNYKEFLTKNGLDVEQKALQSSLLFNIDPSDMSLTHNWMKNDMANAYYKQQTDSAKSFDGLPVKMFTNENGLSTIVSQSYNQYDEVESRARPNAFSSYLGKIGITQYGDDGKELWGVVLPVSQYYKSYKHFYPARQLSKRWQDLYMFADVPPQVYNRQFVSFNTYSYNKNYYVIYNDDNKNFGNSISAPGDTVYNFESTNACYYKINKKKEVTKSYLFGVPAANEYKTSFIEGADFDEQKGLYATLVQCKKDGGTTLCMAWCRLD